MGGTAAAAAALGLAACDGNSASTDGGNGSASKNDVKRSAIIVFAAASMTESLTRAGDQFAAANDQYELSFNYDSSGTLKTQIQEGADCDVFISAGQKQMNQMDITAAADVNTEGLDLIDHDTRFDILENKVTLVVPEGNPKNIQSFDDLASHLQAGDILMVMGNSDVPVGQYTLKIFNYYGIDETAVADKLTYGSNVKEVTTQVSEGAVDCGIIYGTDAFSAGLTVVDEATAEMCGQVIYPAAVLSCGEAPEAGQAFLDFLCTGEALACFEAVGFSPLV